MPTYDYQCPNCDAVIEVFHGMNENPRVKCADCGKVMKRLLGTGAGIIFKGAGFYSTDYRSDSYKATEKSESKSGDGKTASASSEKKTEAKSD